MIDLVIAAMFVIAALFFGMTIGHGMLVSHVEAFNNYVNDIRGGDYSYEDNVAWAKLHGGERNGVGAK